MRLAECLDYVKNVVSKKMLRTNLTYPHVAKF